MDRTKLTEDQYKNDQKIGAVETAVHSFRATWAEQISKWTMGEAATADVTATVTAGLDALKAQVEGLATELTKYIEDLTAEVEEEFPPEEDEEEGGGEDTTGGAAAA